MTPAIDAAALTPAQRSAAIYRSVQSELASRLWRAAIGGDGDDGELPAPTAASRGPALSNGFFDLLTAPAAVAPAATPTTRPSPPAASSGAVGPMPALGANARYAPALAAAAARTRLPATALTAIVNAEAAKAPDGSWKLYSRNPRSSAAGLGQFLSGTWESMAATKGTWLNGVAHAKGWLNDAGGVLPSARSALLALRYDAEASISTIADYARQNLNALERAGVPIGDSAESVARVAYIGHQLGQGDAVRFLKNGLDSKRARLLLNAQIGPTMAERRIADAGSAAAAHRNWLLDFVNRRVRAEA